MASDELGDALFGLLALAGSLDVAAGEALAKYEDRFSESGSPGSG